MPDVFKIYPLRLKNGHRETIELEISPTFLCIEEKELNFLKPVIVRGEAYLADDHLILHLDVQTTAQLPCLVCNDPVNCAVQISDFYAAEPLEQIPGGCFDYGELLREAILLQVPAFAECQGGHCPQRQEINKFLKKNRPAASKEIDPHTHFPFADLDKNRKVE